MEVLLYDPAITTCTCIYIYLRYVDSSQTYASIVKCSEAVIRCIVMFVLHCTVLYKCTALYCLVSTCCVLLCFVVSYRVVLCYVIRLVVMLCYVVCSCRCGIHSLQF